MGKPGDQTHRRVAGLIHSGLCRRIFANRHLKTDDLADLSGASACEMLEEVQGADKTHGPHPISTESLEDLESNVVPNQIPRL